MEPTFRDQKLQSRFREDGFVCVQLLDCESLERLRLIYSELAPSNGIGFHTTICGDGVGRKVVTDSVLRAEVGPAIESVLREHRVIFGNFAIRYPGPESEILVHQDWAFVDERESVSVGIWCPLLDETMPLSILEKSHRWLETHRGTTDATLPNYAEAYAELLSGSELRQLASPVPLQAGEALFFDHRLAYFSPPNLSPDVDVAMLFGALPGDSDMLHFRRTTPTRVDVFRVSPRFLVEQEFGVAPTGNPVGHQAYVSRSLSPPQ